MKLTLLIFLIIVLLFYIPLNRQSSLHSLKTKIDDNLPLLPWSVWIYTLYYPLLPTTTLILWNQPLLIKFLISEIIGSSIAVAIWWFYPNGVNRPTINTSNSLPHKLLKQIYSHDKDCNGLPSGHITHAVIACFYLAQTFPHFSTPIALLAIAISISTVTTKQHYIVDYIFSVPFSLGVISFTSFLLG